MGISLEEYAAAHPMEQPAQEVQENSRSWIERREDLEQAEQLKQNILTQLQSGEEPQIILYTALHCIGLYSSDPEFIEQAQGCLDSVYKDLMQQSLLLDDKAAAAERLEAMQSKYNEKLRNTLNRQLTGYKKIAAALNEALDALEGIDPAELNEP